ncbi:MAG TPA: hypothetical protein PKC49_06985, partial [Phycisphaerae bacterium]|nr:hypothetical protein [Phycisphaerae bacterium]
MREQARKHSEPPPMGGGPVEGVLELQDKGPAFLRDPKRNYAARSSDPQVPPEWVRKYELRGGETLAGPREGLSGGDRPPLGVTKLPTVNSVPLR